MTSQTYPSGRVIGYSYDDKGELVSISIDGVPFISNIKTNDNGLLSYEYNDGSKHTREYDTNGRVTKLSYSNYTEEVNYNVVSNITKIKADTISRIFGYDNLDRLTSYEQNATDFQKFVYDANGNRLNQNQENNETKLFTYALNSNILNSIKESNTTDTTNISYEYDKTGNIIKDDKHTYSYDSRNRLVAVDSNVTYQYNYDNKRVSKTVNGVKTYFIYDGHKLIGEYKLNLSDNSREEYVYLNSTPIAVITPKGTYRLYADHLDTPRRVATNDEDATVLWKWESKPFGESMADEDVDKDGERFVQNLRFPGQYFDTELKTHYNINRDYNPVTGRYIQSDPVGFDGGLNTYVYVGNNPLVRIDEEGYRADFISINTKTYANRLIRWQAFKWNSPKDYYSIVVHGYHGIVPDFEAFDNNHKGRISSRLLNKIKSSKKSKVWLVACESALRPPKWVSENTTNVSFAQRLANQTRTRVKAPNKKVSFNLYTHNPYVYWGGQWIWHYPQ